MSQKTCIVTGANTGLGFETAKGLAKAGHKVYLACRSEDKARVAMKRIQRKQKDADLHFLELDLLDRPGIKSAAEQFSAENARLDILVNNAGVMGPPHTITQNGLELQLDANHMGHFYWTSQLMHKLDQPDETRVINVSSLAGKRPEADIYWDNINFENGVYESGREFMGLKGMTAYCQSKLANLLFTMELKDRLEASGKNIKAIAVHPGASNTDLKRNMKKHLQILAPIIGRFMNISKPEQGAESFLMAALQDDVQAGEFFGPTENGEYNGPAGRVPLPEKAFDKELCKRFWEFSEEQVGEKFRV